MQSDRYSYLRQVSLIFCVCFVFLLARHLLPTQVEAGLGYVTQSQLGILHIPLCSPAGHDNLRIGITGPLECGCSPGDVGGISSNCSPSWGLVHSSLED